MTQTENFLFHIHTHNFIMSVRECNNCLLYRHGALFTGPQMCYILEILNLDNHDLSDGLIDMATNNEDIELHHFTDVEKLKNFIMKNFKIRNYGLNMVPKHSIFDVFEADDEFELDPSGLKWRQKELET